jgi:hypothetical protein
MARKIYARNVSVEEAPRFVKRRREDGGGRAKPNARTRAGRQAAQADQADQAEQPTKEAQPFQEPVDDDTQGIRAAQAGLMMPGAITLTPKNPSPIVALGALGVLAYIGWEFLKADGE